MMAMDTRILRVLHDTTVRRIWKFVVDETTAGIVSSLPELKQRTHQVVCTEKNF